jgi:hypothetical protein
MDNFKDMQQLWLATNAPLPTVDEMKRAIRKYRLLHLLKTTAFLALLVLLFAATVFVVLYDSSGKWTTHLGEALYFVAIMILLSVQLKSLRRTPAAGNISGIEFLNFLKKEKESLIKFEKKTQLFGFLIAMAGLFLFVFDYVHKDSRLAIIMYASLLLFSLVGWFFLRPVFMRNKKKKLQGEIDKFEQMTLHFTDKNL